ncbi:hypothetical protein L1987_43792 [Smallanthus sonchifolius]|uniref:Uncharacterized protein n=1 Tax=Smallanthus sonchifolius TaxID=185202 RepID=A0ACB9GM31_9ASTR|nr:hypothetical protein L1987_43792 [Smallanthus sonchifolius]
MGRFVNQNLRPILYPRVPLNHHRPIRSSEPLDNPIRLTHPVTNKTHFTPLDYPPHPSPPLPSPPLHANNWDSSSSPYTSNSSPLLIAISEACLLHFVAYGTHEGHSLSATGCFVEAPQYKLGARY